MVVVVVVVVMMMIAERADRIHVQQRLSGRV
jgi:hypothetical protein